MEQEAERLRTRAREEHRQAMTDSLTGIPNRQAFEERMAEEFARWKRFHTPLALLVWDVDKFKDINDRYGHKAGDKVLKTLARTLHDSIRETDFLARFGGEEFVLLMTGAEAPALREVADKLRTAVGGCGFHFRGNSVQVTISCGIACFAEGDTPETVFDRADRALYHAKELGRDRCELADT
jgi:diguanylate cyclase